MRIPLLVVCLVFNVSSVFAQEIRFDDQALQGSLGQPLPYEVARVFPDQSFSNPVEFVPEPGSNRIFILELGGRIIAFDPDGGDARDTVADLRPKIDDFRNLYGFAFHPNYLENRLVYVCYALGAGRPNGTQLVECEIDPISGQLVWESRREILTWFAGGHNGACLKFGPDDYLYITAGDAEKPNPPDELGAGQDCSNVLSTVMRIDVDRRDAGLAYAIPPDNPFNDTHGVRPEIWAYGFRNPWKISFDQVTGGLWLGDVGWDTWELVYKVRRGANYGWSIMEGRQPIRITAERGPTPISPPMAEHSHAEARSITGGYVYRGSRLPELEGAYIYGDYETGKIWALWERDGVRIALDEIADVSIRIITFGQTHDGELYLVDYAGGIYVLERRQDIGVEIPVATLPSKLSETGLFASLAEQSSAPGMIPFEIEYPMWSDGLVSQRWFGLPQGGQVRIDATRDQFPSEAVIVKTLSTPSGNPVETQILQNHQDQWRGFSYAWNDDHSDAELIPEHGDRRQVQMTPDRIQNWHSASRSECMVCHNFHAGFVLGFRSWQFSEAQRKRFIDLGLLRDRDNRNRGNRNRGNRGRRGNDRTRDQVAEARTYLDVNCASCHRLNGGGLVPMKLERHLPDRLLAALEVPPERGDFEIQDARVIDPGRPEKSTLYYRMAKLGSGRMPHLGSQVVDERGLRLIYDWIESLSPEEDRSLQSDEAVSLALKQLHNGNPAQVTAQAHPFVADLMKRFEPIAATTQADDAQATLAPEEILAIDGDPARGQALLEGARGAICLTCHQLGQAGRDFGPAFDGLGARRQAKSILQSLLNPSDEIETAYVNYTVGTKEGPSHMGFIRHHDRQGVVIRDAALQEVTIPVDAITTMTASDISVMPAGLAAAFTGSEIADLVAYLTSLK